MIPPYQLKVSFIKGLLEIVKDELRAYPDVSIIEEYDEEIYLTYTPQFRRLEALRSVQRVYLVLRSRTMHPQYLSSHKSILGDMISMIIDGGQGNAHTEHAAQPVSAKKQKDPLHTFRTYTIRCAGADSKEVMSLSTYIEERFRLSAQDEADLKIQIIKPDSLWEIAIQTSSIPVSMRTYKEFHMSGGIRPSVAYALNRLCHLENAETYLNLCSGSGTLLIEAGLAYPQLRLIGIDHDTKANSMAIRNATKAGLIRRVSIQTASVHALPDVGICDAIVADLPFGMAIAKDDDLHALYAACVSYAETHLKHGGVLALYTTEHDSLMRVLTTSRFTVEREYPLHLVTSVHSYLTPRIYVCRLK